MKHHRSILALLFAGAVAGVVSPAAAQIDVIPESELSPGARFAVAIEDDDIDKVRALLDSGLAADRDQTAMVALLLEAKADPNSVNKYMQSALSNAAAAGNLELTEMLLKAKAKPELPGLVLTPMMFGAFAGNGDLIRLLVRYGADVNYATKEYGQSALTSAITAGKPDMVALLIELGAKVNQKTPDGDTPLKMAKNGDQDDVVAMLKAAGAKE